MCIRDRAYTNALSVVSVICDSKMSENVLHKPKVVFWGRGKWRTEEGAKDQAKRNNDCFIQTQYKCGKNTSVDVIRTCTRDEGRNCGWDCERRLEQASREVLYRTAVITEIDRKNVLRNSLPVYCLNNYILTLKVLGQLKVLGCIQNYYIESVTDRGTVNIQILFYVYITSKSTYKIK